MSLLLRLRADAPPQPKVEYGWRPSGGGIRDLLHKNVDWWTEREVKRALDANLDVAQAEHRVTEQASKVLSRVASIEANVDSAPVATEARLLAAMNDAGVRYRASYAAALAAYIAVYREFNAQMQRIREHDEDTAVVLLLLH